MSKVSCSFSVRSIKGIYHLYYIQYRFEKSPLLLLWVLLRPKGLKFIQSCETITLLPWGWTWAGPPALSLWWEKFHYLYYIQDGFVKSPLLLLCLLLRASFSLFNLIRHSHYYLEEGLEQGLSLRWESSIGTLITFRMDLRKAPGCSFSMFY